ncbi:MAG: hypothetical protein ACHP84_18325 [Caulobacterales bacterium]
MAVKQSKPDIGAAATGAMDTISHAVTDAAERSREMVEASLENWNRESQRFYEEFAAQGAEAMEQLKNCKSPLDVLSVEQAWIAARSKAYMDSGLRFAKTFAEMAESLKARQAPPSA